MFVIMAPYLVCVLACLKAPIGDPETSKLDSNLAGVWLGKEDDELGMLVLQPFDKRTYLVGVFNSESGQEEDGGENPEKEAPQNDEANEDGAKRKGGEEKLDQINVKEVLIFKGWLTTIGGQQFMCWEPKFMLDKESGMKPGLWFVWKVKLEKNSLSLCLVDDEKQAGETSKEIEKFIKANYLDDNELKDKDWTHFRKIDKSKYDEVAEALEKMGIGGF